MTRLRSLMKAPNEIFRKVISFRGWLGEPRSTVDFTPVKGPQGITQTIEKYGAFRNVLTDIHV